MTAEKIAVVKPKKRLSGRKKVLLVLVVFLALLGGSGYALSQTLTGPAIGTVVTNLPAVTKPTEVELEQFDGTLFSFVHPMSYIEQANKPNPNNLEARTFISSGMATRIVTIVVTKFQSGRLEDDPSYLMRSQETTKYKMRSLVIKNEKVVVFNSTDPQQYQQAAFWPHQGKLLTFTMTGVASDPEGMNKEYQYMLESISWR